MIIVTNPLNPYLYGAGREKIYQSPQKVADEYNNFHAAMEKIKQIPIVYISIMGLQGGDFDIELNDE